MLASNKKKGNIIQENFIFSLLLFSVSAFLLFPFVELDQLKVWSTDKKH